MGKENLIRASPFHGTGAVTTVDGDAVTPEAPPTLVGSFAGYRTREAGWHGY